MTDKIDFNELTEQVIMLIQEHDDEEFDVTLLAKRLMESRSDLTRGDESPERLQTYVFHTEATLKKLAAKGEIVKRNENGTYSKI